MSIIWIGRVRDHAPKSNARKFLVLLALADYANQEGECWPSVSSIAKWAGVQEKQARRYLRDLTAEGYIEIIQKGGGTYKTVAGKMVGIPNRYKIVEARLIPSPAREGEIDPSHNEKEPSLKDESPSLKTKSPSLKKGENPLIEPSIEPSEEPLKIPKAVLKEAELYFSELTKIDLPKRKTHSEKTTASTRWWKPLREMLVLCDGNIDIWKAGLSQAIREFDKDGLTYDSPASFLKKFRSMVAQAKRGVLSQKHEPKGLSGGREFLSKGSG